MSIFEDDINSIPSKMESDIFGQTISELILDAFKLNLICCPIKIAFVSNRDLKDSPKEK